jgi:hypothetical protein
MRRFSVCFWNTLLLLTLLVGCQRADGVTAPAETAPRVNSPIVLPAVLDAWPVLSGRHPDVPGEYDLVAESEHLRLYLNKATSALIVEDRRNGRLWRSSPVDLQDFPRVSQSWRKRIASPVLISYTDADRGQAIVLDPEDLEIDVAPVEGGVRATYRFPAGGLELDVIYVVRDDFLKVTVPADSIVESGENTLVGLDVLTFLGATHDGQAGYIAFPDGSGALMGYTSPHPEEVQEISLPLYGQEQLNTPLGDYQQPAAMPFFGLVSADESGGKAAFAAIITQGDFDAALSVARSGSTVPYNHVGVSFVFRRQGRFSLMGGQPTRLYESNLEGGDRQVRYCFLTEENAHYVGIATRYRDFLIEQHGAQRGGGDTPLMILDFFMGIERRNWFLRELIRMTSFADVQEIMADLDAAGVSRVDVTLNGWNQGGAQSRYPQRLPVEERLGGADGLRALADSLHARGQRLFLTDDYLIALPGGHGVFPYSDAIRGVDGLPVGGGGGVYFINAQVALRKFAVRDIPRMVELNVDGLRLNYFAGLAVPDTNDRYPLSREEFAASWMQIADLAREQFGTVAMSGGNTYAILHTDRLDWVPSDSTHYDLFDEAIPLYQIAVHGLVVYDGQPYNLLNDGQRTFLRQVEYGAIPHFILTHEDSALLYRTPANDLYSTQYDFWRDEIVRQYRAMEPLIPLASQFIVGHTRLADGVYQTTYESGVRVVVNYNAQPYASGSLSVPAENFVVLQGDD